MKTIVIRSKLLIDGTGRDPIPNGVVVIEDERIKAVGRSGQVEQPNDAEIIDLRDQTVLPGLVDAHSHCVLRAEVRTAAQQRSDPLSRQVLRAANNLRADLLSGVTTMRTLGDPEYIDVFIRDAINDGESLGPRLMVAAAALLATHAHGMGNGVPADGIDAVRRQTRESIFRGADVIKIFATGMATMDPAAYQLKAFDRSATYSRAEFQTIIEEAHRVGVRVTAHAHGGDGLRDCIESGIDSIEHAALIENSDIELFLKHNTWLVGTNTVLFDPELGLMAKKDFQTVPEYHRAVIEAQEITQTMHMKAVAAGVKYSMGSDGRHGSFYRELEYACMFGMTPMQAIVAATHGAAQVLGIDDRIGTLEPGKFADVISVGGEVLKDVKALRNVGLIMKAGRRFDQFRVYLNGREN